MAEDYMKKGNLILKPFGTRVLVQKIKTPPKIGSIIIPDAVQQTTYEAEVLLVGPKFESPDALKPGDRIIFDKYSGTAVEYDNEEYFFIIEKDIIGLVNK